MTVLLTIFLGPDACFIGIIESANLLHVSMLMLQWNKMWDINMEKELSAIPTLILKKNRIGSPNHVHCIIQR